MYRNNAPLEQLPVASQESLLSHRFNESYIDGRYFQPCSPAEYQRRVIAVQEKLGANGAEDVAIADFQKWAELDWLTPHGTYETGLRLGEKLFEEAHVEFAAELLNLSPRSETAHGSQDASASRLEGGDALWVLMASASNSGIDLDVAIRAKFSLEQEAPLAFGDLHQLVSGNPFWVPLWTGVDPVDIGDPFIDRHEIDPQFVLRLCAVHIHELSQLLYWGGTRTPQDAPQELQTRASDMYADTALLLTYYAHQYSRTTISDVAALNFQKISARVQDGLIDKNLGGR